MGPGYLTASPPPLARLRHACLHPAARARLSAAQRHTLNRNFTRDGFVVVRGAIPPGVLEALAGATPRWSMLFFRPLEALLRWAFGSTTTMDSLWVSYQAFGLFWAAGPVPGIVSAAIAAADPPGPVPGPGAEVGPSVRLLTDFVLTMPGGGTGGPLFTKWHRDTTSFDIVGDGDEGYSAWIPLQDIDSGVGGSLFVVNKSAIPAGGPHC